MRQYDWYLRIYRTNIFSILVFVSLIVAIFFNPYTYYWSDRLEAYYYYFLLLITSVLFVITKGFFFKGFYEIKSVDLAIFLLWAVFVTSDIVNGFLIHNEQLLSFSLAYISYLILRNVQLDVQVIRWFIIIVLGCYVTELIVGVSQLSFRSGAFMDNQINFRGTLDNSGMFAIFITACSCILIQLGNIISNKVIKIVFSLTIFVIAFAIVLTCGSRSSFLSFIAVITYYCYCYFPAIFNKIKVSIFKKTWLLLTLAILGVSAIIFLFFFKTNSSLGRILIWSISLNHFFERPFLGIGFGYFPIQYSDWQNSFFSNNNEINPSLATVADMNYEMFNESIQVLVETGIVGIAAYIFLIYKIIVTKLDRSRKQYAILFPLLKGVLLFIFVSSFFSYPFHSTPIQIVFFLSLALVVNMSEHCYSKIDFSKLKFTVALLTTIFLVSFFVHFLRYLGSLRRFDGRIMASNLSNITNEVYKEAQSTFNYNGILLNRYGKKLFEASHYKEAIYIMNISKKRFIDENTFIVLGLSYQKLKDYDKAEKEFLYLGSLIPNRFKPKYLLVKMYLEKGDTLSAKTLAKSIIAMPVKISSPEIDDIKQEMNILTK